MTFKHSGDLGDIIWALPAIRALGGGTLYLDPAGGLSEPCVNAGLMFRGGLGGEGRDVTTKLTVKAIQDITPMLMAQPCIHGVVAWEGQQVDANLDTFRMYVREDRPITHAVAEAMFLDPPNPRVPWLHCDDPAKLDRPILIARSLRYHACDEFWSGLKKKVQDDAQFVGLPHEYETFKRTFPGLVVPYLETPTILDLFKAVAGADQVISNQGLIHSFAEGLKKRLILEVYRGSRRCVVERPGAHYV